MGQKAAHVMPAGLAWDDCGFWRGAASMRGRGGAHIGRCRLQIAPRRLVRRVALAHVGGDLRDLRLRGEGVDELALVDVCLTRQLGIGGRAVWRGEDLSDLYASFAEPTAIGLSAIAAMAHPVSRDDPFGIHVRFGSGRVLKAPVMPGTIEPVSVAGVHRLRLGVPVRLQALSGTVALDGEREIEVDGDSVLHLELDWGGPRTVAVGAVLAQAAQQGLLFSDPGPMDFPP